MKPPAPPQRWPARLVALLVGAGLAVIVAERCPPAQVSGEIRARGAVEADFTLPLATCFDGDHWDFDGVWVAPLAVSDGGRRGFKGGLKLARSGAELAAYVEHPNTCQAFRCSQHRVDAAHCEQYDLRVVDTRFGLRRAGHARLRCQHPSLGKLEVDTTFDGCASPPSGADP